MNSFNLSDRELNVIRKILTDSLSKNSYGDFLNLGVDLHVVMSIRDDIDMYFDVMESRASDQMLMENIHLGME